MLVMQLNKIRLCGDMTVISTCHCTLYIVLLTQKVASRRIGYITYNDTRRQHHNDTTPRRAEAADVIIMRDAYVFILQFARAHMCINTAHTVVSRV